MKLPGRRRKPAPETPSQPAPARPALQVRNLLQGLRGQEQAP